VTDREKLLRLGTTFIFVVRTETFSVNRAALILDCELKKGLDDSDATEVWEAVYSILSHSANLSKIFWPVKVKAAPRNTELQERAKLMRGLFEVTDESPLANRDVRNGFEHLDERIHDWLDEIGPTHIVDYFIGAAAQAANMTGRHIFRIFDHETGFVTVGSDSIRLQPLIFESDRLYVRWRELEGKPSNDPYA
jgi:hypothetical protein